MDDQRGVEPPQPSGDALGPRRVVAPARTRRPHAGTRPPGPQPRAEPLRAEPDVPSGPAVVAIGGGHGLAVALHAIRRYAGTITAVVSVADDGGSSGRLRRDLDVPAPGDLRKCLVALAGSATSDATWVEAFEHRFEAGELSGHALGNLLIVGLAEALGDLPAALAECGRLVGSIGRVLPATIDPVVITAAVNGATVEGQVAVAEAGARGRIRDVRLRPDDAAACPEALLALSEADQVVIGPGSLYTSLVAALAVPAIRKAVEAAPGRVVQVANLGAEQPETTGLDGTDHLLAVLDHGVRVDTFVFDPSRGLPVDDGAVWGRDVLPVGVDLSGPDAALHDPAKLATALAALL